MFMKFINKMLTPKCQTVNQRMHQFGCVELSHLTTAKPLTKLVTGGGFFSTDVCPCSVALPSPLVLRISFFLFSSSIFFLNISMKLPSLANAFPPDAGAWLAVCAGLLDGDDGLPQLESPLLLPLLLLLLLLLLLAGVFPCARFELMLIGVRLTNKQTNKRPAQIVESNGLFTEEYGVLFQLACNVQYCQCRTDSTRNKEENSPVYIKRVSLVLLVVYCTI